MPKIILKTRIKADQLIVFNLSRSVDLHLLSTAKTNEKAIAGKTSGFMELNDTVTWRAKHLGFYQNLTTKITEFKNPDYFADEMISGAFKSFKHEHIFETLERETIMTDIFTYCSPLGILGKIADYLFLKNYMTHFLLLRNKTIKDCAENDPFS